MDNSWRYYLAIMLITGCPATVLAAPSTPSAPANIQHGTSITVTGTGFGVKSPAAPLLWDSVDGMYASIVNGEEIPVGGTNPWGWDSDDAPVTFHTTNPRGKWTAKYSNWNSTDDVRRASVGGNYYPGSNLIYASWWMWVGNTTTWHDTCYSSDKWTRFSDSTSMSLIEWQPVSRTIYQAGVVDDTDWSAPHCGIEDQWQRMEKLVDNDSVPRHPAMWTWLNNAPIGPTPFLPSTSMTVDVTAILSIGYDSSNDPGVTRPTIDFGEIYVDNTRARVEICNNSNKTSATHCEIQIPSEWDASGDRIVLTVNQGSFADDSSAYLFVSDSAGDFSATGELVTFSDGGGDTTPATTTITSSDPLNVSSSSATVAATCADETAVGGAKWAIGVNPDATHGTACSGTTSASCSVTGLSSGNNDVRVACYDTSNNYDAIPDSITVNYTPPAVNAVMKSATCSACQIRY